MIGITNVVNKRKSEAERMNLTLKTNQSKHTDLLGVNFTLTYGTYTKIYTWNGSTITIEVPNGVEYTLTFPDVEGYACNTKSVTYTAQSGNSRMLEVLYQCELLTVNVSADNGVPTGFEVKIQTVELLDGQYAELECIESDGSQWIDTGFTPNQDTRLTIEYGGIKGTGWQELFGAGSSVRQPSLNYIGVVNDLNSVQCQYNTKYANAEATNERNVVDFNKNAFYVNGSLVSTLTASSFTSPYSLTLFDAATNDEEYPRYSGKLYSCKIYNNGVLVRDYIPVLRIDGVAGLYDLVNKSFARSNGANDFVGGAVKGDVLETQTSAVGVYKIPYGVGYVLNWNQLENFETSGVYFKISDRPSNIVNIEYTHIDDAGITNPSSGVWIQGITGKFYTKENWSSNKTPNGIAVITDNCSFCLALTDASLGSKWSQYGTTVTGVTVAKTQSEAYADYDGEVQTSLILDVFEEGRESAARHCWDYYFPNGKRGYLGAAGEWKAVIDNINAVEEALAACGGNNLSPIYWTSTQYGESNSWLINHYEASAMWQTTSYSVRAFTTL